MSVSAKSEEGGTSESTSTPSFLITTIHGRYLAFEAEFIHGIVTSEDVEICHDPGVQGVTYPVIDLAVRLHPESERLWDGTDVVLLADGKCRGSVRVQKVHGILAIHRSQVLPLPAQFRGAERRWYSGMILFDHSVALVLNTAWVLEEQLEGTVSRTQSQGAESLVVVQEATQGKHQAC